MWGVAIAVSYAVTENVLQSAELAPGSVEVASDLMLTRFIQAVQRMKVPMARSPQCIGAGALPPIMQPA